MITDAAPLSAYVVPDASHGHPASDKEERIAQESATHTSFCPPAKDRYTERAVNEPVKTKFVTKKTRRKKGTGSLFKRGNVWWYALTVNSVTERKSTGCTNRDDAEAFLRERNKELKREGLRRAPLRPKKITVQTLITTLRSKYEEDEKASKSTVGGYVKAWEASPLWQRDAEELRYDDFDRQAQEWQTQPWQAKEKGSKRIVSNATINRRMALLEFPRFRGRVNAYGLRPRVGASVRS